MAPAEAPARGYDVLVAALSREFDLSVAGRLRLEALRAALAGKGVRADDPILARWLSPVFCTTPREQAAFAARFKALSAELGEALSAPEPAAGAASGPAAAASAASAAAAARPHDDDRAANAILAGSMALIVGVTTALVVARDPPQVVKDLVATLPTARPPPVVVNGVLTQVFDGLRLALQAPVWPWALLALVPLAIGGLAALALWLWRRRQQDRFSPTPEASRPLALAASLSDFFAAPEVLKSVASLGRHRPAPGGRLHARRTLRATLQKGGYPTLRFGTRPQLPQYVILVDQESPRDHLPLVGEALARRLREQNVTASRYHYDRNPRRLRVPDSARDAQVSLSEVSTGRPNARYLLISEPDRLLQRAAGEAAPWLSELAQSASVTLLTPRRASAWSRDEAALRRAGVALLPATPDGVRLYADWLTAGPDAAAPELRDTGPRRIDLPYQLGRRRAALLGAQPLSPDDLAGLMMDLRTWLGAELMRLLRALAVFPRLEPALTLALGRAMKDPRGRPLLNDDTLLRLVRLPWLRAGRMPEGLRAHLSRGLSAADLKTASRIIHAFLTTEAEVLRRGVGPPPKRRDLLVQWLRAQEDSDLHDAVLIGALNGRPAEQLGGPIAQGLGERVREGRRDPAMVSAAVGLAAAMLAIWSQPTYRSELRAGSAPAPQATPPPTPDASKPAAAEDPAPVPDAAATPPPKASAKPATRPPRPTRPQQQQQQQQQQQATVDPKRLAEAQSLRDQLFKRLVGFGANIDVLDKIDQQAKRGDVEALRQTLYDLPPASDAVPDTDAKSAGAPQQQQVQQQQQQQTLPATFAADARVEALRERINQPSRAVGEVVVSGAGPAVPGTWIPVLSVRADDCKAAAPTLVGQIGPAHGEIEVRPQPGQRTPNRECGVVTKARTDVYYRQYGATDAAAAADIFSVDDRSKLRRYSVSVILASPAAAAAK